ncbi:hypothetical protein [Streptomyces sp. NPDC046862]|uniref:hypothetical protein n=1 Tax=Streptomyces sp. NPDC046862 TaxID=3154603 RepID=UPI003452ED99
MTGTDLKTAYRNLTEHRFYRYRGCAPDPDDPTRMAGNPELSLDAHHGPDMDGQEPQAERLAREAAAEEVCLNCPVMVLCDAYATSVTSEGKLAEPEGFHGGRKGLARHRVFISERHKVVAEEEDRKLRTKQKLAVLAGLAAHTDPYEVAAAAGVDVRTANWQRSTLVTGLCLPRTASRGELLAAAAERGLVDGDTVVPDDGTVPAIPPECKAEPREEFQDSLDDHAQAEAHLEPAGGPLRLQSPRRDRFTDVAGQLALWEAELSDLADVHDLFPNPASAMEAAA